MDSFGIGGAEDAASFGDEGADTLGHINDAHPLSIPNMASLGLAKAYENNMGKTLKLAQTAEPAAGCFYGVAQEHSAGKDTLSGHWEMAGVQMDLEMVYFSDTQPTFPAKMIEEIIAKSDIEGILGDRHASGLEVIETLGEEHICTGYPIFYTSADSVLQIAAHEEHFGLERLYRLCEVAREITNSYGVGRVIARPFIGESAERFERTKNRHDYAMRPSGKSVLEIAVEHGREVIGIGKIHDIFGGHGISTKVPAYTLEGLMDATLEQIRQVGEGSIIYTNFVDFDMEWGHRRDVEGYAEGLEYFDRRVPEVLALLGERDLLIITADHGCDPSWRGTDHTRENVPVFGILRSRDIGDIGIRETFADMAATISAHLGIPSAEQGRSFLS
jgi:phosphopentomutase